MDFQLELKQIVDYPRCSIYRKFIRSLMEDRNIRTNGSSYLFYYMILCSYANFRSSYRRIEGISYLVGPDEWICKTSELTEWFCIRFQHQALSILDFLQKQNYITYTQLGRNNLIKLMNYCYNGNERDSPYWVYYYDQISELCNMASDLYVELQDIKSRLWYHMPAKKIAFCDEDDCSQTATAWFNTAAAILSDTDMTELLKHENIYCADEWAGKNGSLP